eukprot:CAMPEP_0185707582 /NCGR_PEP_ID=MMETSP1164-20130828/24626_1 /TAXON_ID=1104430 /ORGANISM="Chrysoreinhardia sp, Strain CCMP2950" /LENGTH=262 /DNA_ID=CAMNT_0028375011 /DNA_START=82 /DNA_END=867 /DNA_ORIENTATION=+
MARRCAAVSRVFVPVRRPREVVDGERRRSAGRRRGTLSSADVRSPDALGHDADELGELGAGEFGGVALGAGRVGAVVDEEVVAGAAGVGGGGAHVGGGGGLAPVEDLEDGVPSAYEAVAGEVGRREGAGAAAEALLERGVGLEAVERVVDGRLVHGEVVEAGLEVLVVVLDGDRVPDEDDRVVGPEVLEVAAVAPRRRAGHVDEVAELREVALRDRGEDAVLEDEVDVGRRDVAALARELLDALADRLVAVDLGEADVEEAV